MNKTFTENEVRAYSKNRFEERALRHRLEKLRDELVIYHDTSAKYRMSLIEENKNTRRTSGGSPVPAELMDLEEDFYAGNRLRRPWAYSAMETTYNSVYRDAGIQTPRKSKRSRAKSAVTIMLYNSSSVNTDGNGDKVEKVELPMVPCTSQSARHAGIVSFVNQANDKYIHDRHLKADQINHTANENAKEDASSVCMSSDSNQDNVRNPENHFHTSSKGCNDVDDTNEKTETLFNDMIIDTRPYARVLSLPPAYTIDSQAYQEAERNRLIHRSRSRVSFSSSSGITAAANPNDSNDNKDKQGKNPDKQDKIRETKEIGNTNEAIDTQDEITFTTEDLSNRTNKKDRDKNILRASENVTFRGHVIKHYIRPEDRYKLDPSVLNRRQKRMDKLAKESSTYLKRVNHENIRVEIAFPRSARKRLLTKLVQDNNSGIKKTITNNDAPFIQTKIERFMVSISDFVEKQQLERAKTFVC